ncbi:MAG TPA: VIT and VWA domain-containing protein, partial [Polyangiaceae bacterium]|nr:VIT and VWA domain-containing protein [Polyangiaceae bacterium]
MRRSTLLISALSVTALACATVVTEERSLRLAQQEGLDIPAADDGLPGVASPMTLTASDGTGLTLVSLTASAVVEDPLAFTELTLVFENPLDRQLEGQFKITLPQEASLSRFAMKVDDAWQEGEVVEKQAARRAYEDFLHRKQDPALLEQGGGNEFAARVFPIPARGRKQIVLSYSETLKGDTPYRLPLRGLPKLQELSIEVRGGAGTGGPKTFQRREFAPARDFLLAGRGVARNAAIASDELAIARVIPFAESRPEPVGRAVVLVDTSASRALDLAEEAALLGQLAARLPPETLLSVHAFDEEVAPLYDGPAGGLGEAPLTALRARRALGASNLELALQHAKLVAQKAPGTKRVILLTDGVASAGETDAAKLAGAVEALAGAGVERLDAVAVGSVRDEAFLRRITGNTLKNSGVVLSSDRGAEVIARRLGEACSRGVPIAIEGARWSYPRVLDGVQAGDEVLVYAELSEPRPLVVTAGGHTFRPAPHKVERPLLERSWAKAKIDSLVAVPLSQGEAATRKAIVDLSTKHRVVSPHTSFLVLETEQDYARFHIDRRAKLDILTVADGRVQVVHRSRGRDDDDAPGVGTRAKGEESARTSPWGNEPRVARQAALREGAEVGGADPLSARGNMWGDAIGDSFGAGGLGLSGIGE